MKLLRLLCVGLFAGQAKGVACPQGVIHGFLDECAGVDKSFHKILPAGDGAAWRAAIRGILKLPQTVRVTFGIDVSYWKFAFLTGTDKWKWTKHVEEITGLEQAWQNGDESDVKWVVESKTQYWRGGSVQPVGSRQLKSDDEVFKYLNGVGADVVRADEALDDGDKEMPAEAVLGALVAAGAKAGNCAMAVYTGDFDAIFSRCWICPSVPKSGHNRLDMATHTTIWDRDKLLAIMKIDLRMLALLFTLAFNSMLQSFRKEVMFPTLEGGVAMKQWADALGAVALGLGVGAGHIVDLFKAKVALGRQNPASVFHLSIASARRSLAAQLLVINQMVDAAVALRPSGYDELLRRDAHYQESAELQR